MNPLKGIPELMYDILIQILHTLQQKVGPYGLYTLLNMHLLLTIMGLMDTNLERSYLTIFLEMETTLISIILLPLKT